MTITQMLNEAALSAIWTFDGAGSIRSRYTRGRTRGGYCPLVCVARQQTGQDFQNVNPQYAAAAIGIRRTAVENIVAAADLHRPYNRAARRLRRQMLKAFGLKELGWVRP